MKATKIDNTQTARQMALLLAQVSGTTTTLQQKVRSDTLSFVPPARRACWLTLKKGV